ncbi:hypothetical protein HMPREF0083_01506 [Aneurinibacillus aneurinilyticus ATCC 12856]|uniref:Uncharacterized protein n=1 Tax=Aneurinibacillus aneurinilyticus ATCC 12856 TaxID=649747 RepID=U1YE89_ANEAE|nr:hypothetical protein HMPREF0083_01506 [Aneurinibacillus aneurinilyticus ATCC 12856]
MEPVPFSFYAYAGFIKMKDSRSPNKPQYAPDSLHVLRYD